MESLLNRAVKKKETQFIDSVGLKIEPTPSLGLARMAMAGESVTTDPMLFLPGVKEPQPIVVTLQSGPKHDL